MNTLFRIPHARYVIYLYLFVVREESEIERLLHNYGYPGIPAGYLEEIDAWEEEHLPTDESGEEFSDEAMAELRKCGVTTFVDNGPLFAEASALHSNVRPREIVQVCAIAGMDSGKELSDLILDLADYQVSPAAVNLYLKLYWDLSKITARDWKKIYGDDPFGYVARDIHLRRSYEYALYCLGYRVDVDPKRAWQAVRHEGFMRFFESASLKPGLATAQSAKLWAEIAAMGDDKLREAQPLQDVLERFMKKLRIDSDTSEVPSIEDLE